MNSNWLSKRRKVEKKVPSLFNIAAACVANNNIKDEFCWKLISEHKEEKYTVIHEVCYRCINFGLNICDNHKVDYSKTIVRGDNLRFAAHTAVLPYIDE